MIAGRYTLEREIGRGGTGPVWLAHDEMLQRPVAMKRIGLLPGVDEFDRARAEREARLSAQLHHANVVQVHDVAVAEDGITHWLVMEYVDGPSLGHQVKEGGPVTPDQARPLLAQVAGALLAAHEAGIVHRDVKPSNILLDQNGTAKLTDFGIARVASDPQLTQTGLLTGSPAYLAPEVAAGETGDERSDVWALGATAFHLLSGRPPYDVDSNVLGTLYKIVHDDAPRLENAGELEAFLTGTMTKDPAERWTMQQVVDALAGGAVPPSVPVAAPVAAAAYDEGTQLMTVPPTSPPIAKPTDRRASKVPDIPMIWVAAVAGVIALLLIFFLLRGLIDNPESDTGSDSPTDGTSQSATPDDGDQPTAEGMEAFVREYVEKIGENPATSWPMLSASFQRKSGGFDQYADFWDGARDPRVSKVEADPESLVVSYDVKWKGHSNGPRTRLLLAYQDGRYLIDDEITEGFEPTG